MHSPLRQMCPAGPGWWPGSGDAEPGCLPSGCRAKVSLGVRFSTACFPWRGSRSPSLARSLSYPLEARPLWPNMSSSGPFSGPCFWRDVLQLLRYHTGHQLGSSKSPLGSALAECVCLSCPNIGQGWNTQTSHCVHHRFWGPHISSSSRDSGPKRRSGQDPGGAMGM